MISRKLPQIEHPIKLGVNIDHIATLRQARCSPLHAGVDASGAESARWRAAICERAGAQGITVHLRADRRHIQDRDVIRLRQSLNTKLNLEMGNALEILEIALKILPEDVCLVPENRKEITTEGGLDAAAQIETIATHHPPPAIRRASA